MKKITRDTIRNSRHNSQKKTTPERNNLHEYNNLWVIREMECRK